MRRPTQGTATLQTTKWSIRRPLLSASPIAVIRGTDTTETIENLDADTSYQVRVVATNAAGDGPWSLSSVGSTNKEDNILPSVH